RIKIKPRVRLRRKGAPAEGARSISVLRLALVLFAAILTNLAYFVVNQPLVDQPYYTILRMMVSFASLYAASCALYLRCEELLFILLPVAILFNPILPVAISFEEWFALNWFIPALLLYVLFALHMRNQPQD
ncbi:MAG TPA: DUF6804 family protein, partial [Elusimicrobiota bacterium]|nr:DUF6804 family protein [Elusimicrobiota bacterium]